MYASDNVHDAAGDECVQVRNPKRQCSIFPLIRIPGDSIRLSSELNRAKSKKGVIPKKRHAQRGIFLSLSLLHRHVILLMQPICCSFVGINQPVSRIQPIAVPCATCLCLIAFCYTFRIMQPLLSTLNTYAP